MDKIAPYIQYINDLTKREFVWLVITCGAVSFIAGGGTVEVLRLVSDRL